MKTLKRISSTESAWKNMFDTTQDSNHQRTLHFALVFKLERMAILYNTSSAAFFWLKLLTATGLRNIKLKHRSFPHHPSRILKGPA